MMVLALSAIRFALVGVVNSTVGLGVIFLSKAWLGLGDLAANVVGYAVGLMIAFGLNRQWTFAHKGRVSQSAARFLVAFLVAYTLNLATVLVLIDVLSANAYLAQAAGVIPYTIAFFLLSRWWVFRNATGALTAAP